MDKIYTRRTVEYEVTKDVFVRLASYLEHSTGYKAHLYRADVINQGTIDDGSSTDFHACSRFSEFKILDDTTFVLRVHDQTLAKTIDSYFTGE